MWKITVGTYRKSVGNEVLEGKSGRPQMVTPRDEQAIVCLMVDGGAKMTIEWIRLISTEIEEKSFGSKYWMCS